MTEDQAEARAVCEHFYASHCYRGMSIRLCMMCHEPDWDDLAGQLASAARGSEIAAPEPLVMSADEFAALTQVAATLGWTVTKGCGCAPGGPCEPHAELSPAERLRQMVAEHENALSAVRRALEFAAEWIGGGHPVIAAGWAGLKVLEDSDEETRDGK